MVFSSYFYGRRWTIYSLLFGLFIMSSIQSASAQNIRAQVKITLERLPLEKQQKLKDFAEDIETYISDHDWTGESADDEIPMSVQIFLMDNSVSYEARYSGTFLITNTSDIQYYDKYWRFPYEAGTRLEHNESIFDPFTGFIDFYVYLIIGGEYDKLGKFMGTPYFEKSKLLSDQAKFNARFILGWKERTTLIDRVLSDDYKPFRTMKDFFFLGQSYVGEEDTTAQKYCAQALSLLDDILTKDPGNEEAVQFLKAHHVEYIELFKEDRKILEKLIRIDPNRVETYQQYLKD